MVWKGIVWQSYVKFCRITLARYNGIKSNQVLPWYGRKNGPFQYVYSTRYRLL